MLVRELALAIDQKNELGECFFPEGQSGWKKQPRRLGQLHATAGIQMSSRIAQRRLGDSPKAASLALLTGSDGFDEINWRNLRPDRETTRVSRLY
jgi:hypothetical protein